MLNFLFYINEYLHTTGKAKTGFLRQRQLFQSTDKRMDGQTKQTTRSAKKGEVTHGHKLVAPAQFSAEVSWSAGQDKGHKDAFSIFSPYNVEAKTRGALLQHHLPRLPATHKTHGIKYTCKNKIK